MRILIILGALLALGSCAPIPEERLEDGTRGREELVTVQKRKLRRDAVERTRRYYRLETVRVDTLRPGDGGWSTLEELK